MTEDKHRNGETVVEEADGGPALVFMPFVVMEDLLDKLKLLDYDKDFVRKLRMKPLSRHYFAVQTNPGEQFHIFSTLASWLIRKCGKPFDAPQEFDDPNSTVSNILDSARQLGFSVDFPPNKLKQGCGEQVIIILDHLANEALKITKFKWKRPQYPQEETDEDVIYEDESELTLAKVEEELQNESGDDSEDDEDNIMGMEQLRNLSSKSRGDGIGGNRQENILQPTTDTTEWQLELERVLPQLKVTVHSDSKDWRHHLDQMRHLYGEVDKCLSTTGGQLDKLQSDISRSLEKIHGREKYLNTHLEPQLNKYRTVQEQLGAIKNQYREVSSGVMERSRQLAEITEELDSVKQEIDERSSAMTDGAPLINIKKALSRIKNEIITMDVQSAVIEHSLLQAKLKDKSNMQREISASMTTSPFMATESVF